MMDRREASPTHVRARGSRLYRPMMTWTATLLQERAQPGEFTRGKHSRRS